MEDRRPVLTKDDALTYMFKDHKLPQGVYNQANLLSGLIIAFQNVVRSDKQLLAYVNQVKSIEVVANSVGFGGNN